jgi:RNA polymerase sigma factor (sigma-70 family)
VSPIDVTEPSDAVLWRQAAAGSRESFGLLFDRHARAVYTYLFRRTADWSMAEDLTAAVFLQAWRRRSQVTFDGDSVLPWLLGVARLLLRNSVRARDRYRAALIRAGAERVTAPAGLGDPADLVVSRVDTERQMELVRRAIASLPRPQQETVELCIFAGLDHHAAAIAMGVAVGTVKSRLHRARERLTSELRARRTAADQGLQDALTTEAE